MFKSEKTYWCDEAKKDTAWMSRGSCYQQVELVNVFFPEREDRKHTIEAKEMCRKCPVQISCRLYALAYDATTHAGLEGVWGGMLGWERLDWGSGLGFV